MRILAIRGVNLASLADHFEVDFEAEPIRSSGIFAITGPTGAGKTTLLDAVCLALFDRFPRLDTADRGCSVGRVDGGGHTIKYDDVRSILRHGAPSGFAEVDFAGQDGRNYRSRWEVNRARGKADGNLQSQKLTLWDLNSGQIIGDKKTETLVEIEKRLGLSFDQFRRSVLLAQGDFDTFIRAPSKDRAELLERITGTGIYAQISKASFERAKQERLVVQGVATWLATHQALDEEERAAVEEKVKASETALKAIDVEKDTLGKAKAWYDTKAQCEHRVTESGIALETARESDSVAEPERHALAVVTKALGARAEFEAATECGRKRAKAQQDLNAAIGVEKQALGDRDRAAEAYKAANDVRDAKVAGHEVVGPELNKARRLDTLLGTGKDELRTRQETKEKCAAEKIAAEKVIVGIEAELGQIHLKREENDRWLDDYGAVETLAPRIEDVVKDLTDKVLLERKTALTNKNIEELRSGIEQTAASRRQQEEYADTLKGQQEELADGVDAARQRAKHIDRTRTEARRDTIAAVQAALDDAQDATEDATKAWVGMAVEVENRSRQDTIIRNAEAALTQAKHDLPLTEARLEEAQRNRELSTAAASDDAERLRLALQDGQPCPVCGATEHWITVVDEILKQRAEEDRKRVKELATEHSRLENACTQARTQIQSAEQALEQIEKRRAAFQQGLEEAHSAWRTALETMRSESKMAGVTMPMLASDPSETGATEQLEPFRQALDWLLAESRNHLNELNAAEAEAMCLSKQHNDVQTDLASLQVEIGALKDAEQAKEAERGKLAAELSMAHAWLVAATSRLEAALAPALPDWKERLAGQGDTFSRSCEDLVAEWRERRATGTALAKNQNDLGAELGAKRARVELLKKTAEEAEHLHTSKAEEVARLWTERMLCLGGRPVVEVEKEHKDGIAAAEQVLRDAGTGRQKADQEAATAASNLAGCRKNVEVLESDYNNAEARLTKKLVTLCLSRGDIEAALDKDATWIEGEGERLDRLREAVTVVLATLTDRQQALKQHLATGSPSMSLEGVEVALEGIEVRRKEAQKTYSEALAALRNDDQVRKSKAELQAELDRAREKIHVWEQLDELIGSADGAKFRRFAQALTLTHLIRLANRHLADLHPRYELQRAPEGELVLQVVDRYMADEVRGVHNLSGGERFLISLALALGLASMSSNRGIKVESLFIDEGFGALDSNSLGMAISVLEQLQATGRRVGVVSHIDELKERIGVKVEVAPIGGGRSRVEVITA